MSYKIEQSFSKLCDESSCILVLNLGFEAKDSILDLDMGIDIDKFENRYWGRPCHDGYRYEVRRT